MKCFKKFLFIFVILTYCSFSFAKPKVALVLSGGGAKGLAELPLIEALEEEGIKPDMVLGTSMGALIGSMYAAGYTAKQLSETMLGLDFMEILNDTPVHQEHLVPEAFSYRADSHASLAFTENGVGSVPALLGDQNILISLCELLSKVLYIKNFDELPITYRAIAVDLCTGKPVVFDSGSIINAARSSMSLPAIWTPAVYGDNRLALDGGFRDNMPIRIAKEMGADFVIAVDVINETKVDPENLVDFTTVAIQIFNVIMPNTSLDQHKLADIVLCPDLGDFSLMGFTQARQIYEAGAKCVAERREELHQLAKKMQNAGVELKVEDKDRLGTYRNFPDPIIEKVKIKNVSLVENVFLPDSSVFDKIVGKPLNAETKKFLRNMLSDLRKDFHFTSLIYNLEKGSKDGQAVLVIETNTYKQDFNKIFIGGNNSIQLAKQKDDEKPNFHGIPDFTVGMYFNWPMEMISHLKFANTIQLDYFALPGIQIKEKHLKFNMEIGGGLRYGSLEPKTNLTYDERTINEDKGAFFDIGVKFGYGDRAGIRTGAEYEFDFIRSTQKYYHLINFYGEGIYDSLKNPLVNLKGFKAEYSVKYSMMFNDFVDDEKYIDALYLARAAIRHRFELLRSWVGLGYDLDLNINHLPYELNTGYTDFGGLEGMCGFGVGTLKRDFAIAGITYQQKIANLAGFPIMAVFQTKASICDSYNPFTYEESPANVVFNGLESVDVGAALYLALKTSGGSLILGGSFDRHGNWTVSLGFK